MKETMATKAMTVTGPIDDNLLYCEDCNTEYEGDCPKHGPLLIVNDAEVPSNCPRGSDLGYSRATLPEGLVIKKSRIPKAGLGVFALKDFPIRTRFGPFEGREENSEDVVQESCYCWQILKDGKHSHYLDGKKPSESNWMRFVNCARSEDEQCVTAYQYQGEIYFRAHRHIFAGNEMLVYYGDSFAKELGIRIQRVGNFSRKTTNTEELSKPGVSEDCSMHFCSPCYAAYSKLDDVQKHIAKLTEEKKLADNIYNQKKITGANEVQVEGSVATTPTPDYSQSSKVVCIVQKNLKVFVNEKGCQICSSTDQSNKKDADEAPYNCDVCGVEFNSHGYIQTHKTSNTGDKPFKCDVCDLTFFRSGNLEAHKRKHTGEKPFKCDTCDERFTDRSNLLRHRSKHTDESPYKCETCGVKFATSEFLETHKSKNACEKPYKCEICGMKFTHSTYLQVHTRRHTREKPYKCDVCGVEFAHPGNLNAHKRTHTGEKPYKCDVCNAEFAHCGHLQAHKTQAHKETVKV